MEQSELAILYLSDQVEELRAQITPHIQKLKRKEVHNLRVALHRIRSLLDMTNIESRALEKLDKKLGKVRDLDVAIKNAKLYGLSTSDLKKKRKKNSKAALEFIEENKKKVFNNLDKSALQFEKKFDLKSAAGTLKTKLKNFDHPLEDHELHKVRIGLKKVRFLLESTGKSVIRLKKVQDQLGEVHDLQVLSEFYKKNPHLKNDQRIKSLTAKRTVRPLFKEASRQLNGIH